MSTASTCSHANLHFDTSKYTSRTKFKRPDENKRIAATQPSGRVPKNREDYFIHPSTYPAPLILPGDDLALDGKYPAQSLRSWIREPERNEVTSDRKTIYIVAPPQVDRDVEEMSAWSKPKVKSSKQSVEQPGMDALVAFLEAFYHGMAVELLVQPWSFSTWTPSDEYPGEAIALRTHVSEVRISCRSPRDRLFRRQLSLLDLLDACIEAVPDDAYALLLLVEQDTYEDEDDDFCCGRAFGGSRVAVVSTARYNPILDAAQNIDREHAWPASHCTEFINQHCADEDSEEEGLPSGGVAGLSLSSSAKARSPMRAALTAHISHADPASNSALNELFLSRLCKTVAHELGHCFGIDHCTYYACIMQGSASVREDARQPPYLCPIDDAKVGRATGQDGAVRDRALARFCSDHQDGQLFTAFQAWLEAKIANMR